MPPGYGAPGYGVPPGYGAPPPLRPGVIPLRPLTLADIFNGAITYIRANPKATLGLTTVVVVITQLLALVLSVGPLAVAGQLDPALSGEEVSTDLLLGSSLSSIAGGVASGLAAILLSGLLTVVVGRAVFGAGITIGQAWQRLRGRLWALIGFSVLEVLGAVLLIAAVVGLIAWIGFAAGGAAAVVLAVPLVFGLIAALFYLGTMLTFVPAIIVLERHGIVAAVLRSFRLVKPNFWRVLGIRLLAAIVAQMIAVAVAIPFSFGGQMLMMAASSTVMALVALVLLSVGSAIGQIITSPFNAGVVVLQYTDARIRTEAFDLVLQTGAGYGPGAPAESTDHLWLTGQS
ncbi:hypothetical protein MELE44368_15585 [Mycolicibacterium elephantis DSM 44368]|uniref:Glycerophosphoryl diester phosphodiesterase membrane domain-containing protein n=1 Tax=Mycolicibacterium elephantis DSM 44368 TaxID=1335622 RepID=A0A439DWB4_9MYCO|nr:hypothetical protein MELE44368_15585 [Mycolicibacterium elephantis DSM 44368]